MLTQQPSNKVSQQQIEHLQSMQQSWLFCPVQDLANLFYYKVNEEDLRVSSFQLDQTTLEGLFSNVDANKPINIRLYMANAANVPYGTILQETPSFHPILQIFNTDNIPDNIYTNSVVVEQMHNQHVLTDTPIPSSAAIEMNEAWNTYPKSELPLIFEADNLRINFTTFDENDSGDIRTAFYNDPSADRTLVIYLGYFKPIKADHPFGFRFILNIMANSQNLGLHQDFFEFSNPCPPACLV